MPAARPMWVVVVVVAAAMSATTKATATTTTSPAAAAAEEEERWLWRPRQDGRLGEMAVAEVAAARGHLGRTPARART
jgi:hypothetical protein